MSPVFGQWTDVFFLYLLCKVYGTVCGSSFACCITRWSLLVYSAHVVFYVSPLFFTDADVHLGVLPCADDIWNLNKYVEGLHTNTLELLSFYLFHQSKSIDIWLLYWTLTAECLNIIMVKSSQFYDQLFLNYLPTQGKNLVTYR